MNRQITLIILSFSWLLIGLLSVQFNYSQTPSEIIPLELSKPQTRGISETERHIYRITLSANEVVEIMIRRMGADVVTRQTDKEGKTLTNYDIEPGTDRAFSIYITSTTAGDYFLTVEPRYKHSPAGLYEIYITELRSANTKETATVEATKLFMEATRLRRAGNNAEALPLAEKALTILKEFGEEDYGVSQLYFSIGNMQSDLGNYSQAEANYLKALKIKEKIFAKDELSTSAVLNNLGLLYADRGDYVKAESFFERALEMKKNLLEPDDPEIANVLNNLANLSKIKGDLQQAALLYQKSLKIREDALGEDHPKVAEVLNNIAGILPSSQAEPVFNRALAITEKVYGTDHPLVAQVLLNMAIFYGKTGNLVKAESLCQRAFSIYEKKFGSEHSDIFYSTNLLATLAKYKGDYAKSESLYLRAIAIKEKTQGVWHPDLGKVYATLANLYLLKNEIEKAIAAQTKAIQIIEYNLALNLNTGSEREKYNYLITRTIVESQTLSLHFQSAPNSNAAANLAATTVLQRKGRVLDAMSDSFAALHRRFNAEDQKLFEKLNQTNAKLSGMILNPPKGSSQSEHRAQIISLEKEKESLENQISRRSAGFYENTKPVTLKALQNLIPQNAVLLEFAVYHPASPATLEFSSIEGKIAFGSPRYGVFIIQPNGEIKTKDLGEIKPIDEGIDAWRQALRDPQSKDFQTLARTVDQQIMSPIRSLLGNKTHLLISPDGNLNLIPFEALTDEKNRYLVENYSITYLTSGRDLLRMQTPRESKSQPVLVANPSFGEPDVPKTAGVAKSQSITAARNLGDTYFAPLIGTLQEGRSIQTIFPEAVFLTDAKATETALKQINAPKILHIATHGFFLEDNDPTTKIENPLFRSGLALAGANQRKAADDDGILTALEASGLNLWGTKLVVLSACDTGLGEVKNGEGVYGLRRALVLAGTESLLMSLWSVSDLATRDLMTDYYKNLKAGMGRGAALRQVQLEMLKKPNRRHPFYWASFIQSGDWRNLK
jgi:CHAT domain-containing protein/Tfp pilus assembly protein PilF